MTELVILDFLYMLKQKRKVRFSWYCIFRSRSYVATELKTKMFRKRQTHENL